MNRCASHELFTGGEALRASERTQVLRWRSGGLSRHGRISALAAVQPHLLWLTLFGSMPHHSQFAMVRSSRIARWGSRHPGKKTGLTLSEFQSLGQRQRGAGFLKRKTTRHSAVNRKSLGFKEETRNAISWRWICSRQTALARLIGKTLSSHVFTLGLVASPIQWCSHLGDAPGPGR
jgi:hypothetical protein